MNKCISCGNCKKLKAVKWQCKMCMEEYILSNEMLRNEIVAVTKIMRYLEKAVKTWRKRYDDK